MWSTLCFWISLAFPEHFISLCSSMISPFRWKRSFLRMHTEYPSLSTKRFPFNSLKGFESQKFLTSFPLCILFSFFLLWLVECSVNDLSEVHEDQWVPILSIIHIRNSAFFSLWSVSGRLNETEASYHDPALETISQYHLTIICCTTGIYCSHCEGWSPHAYKFWAAFSRMFSNHALFWTIAFIRACLHR